MKKFLVLLMMFLMAYCANAQDKRFTAFIYTDGVATIKDGFNIGAGVDYQMTQMYFKSQVFVFPDLRGKKYIDFGGSVGFNQHFGRDTWRTYQGFKVALIYRDDIHPSPGFEIGIDKYFKGFYIGGGWSYDLRTDGKEEDPDIKDYWRLSGLLKVGITF